MPEGIKPLTADFMKGIIGRLEKEGRLDGLDAFALYVLAGLLDKYLEVEETETAITTTTARDTEQINPALTYQRQILGNITVLLKEMGLTLGSRSKMKQPEKEEAGLADRLANL